MYCADLLNCCFVVTCNVISCNGRSTLLHCFRLYGVLYNICSYVEYVRLQRWKIIWTVIRRTAYILQAPDIRHDKRNIANKFLIWVVVSFYYILIFFCSRWLILYRKINYKKTEGLLTLMSLYYNIHIYLDIFNITLELFYTITKKYKTSMIQFTVKTTKLFSTDRMTLDTFFFFSMLNFTFTYKTDNTISSSLIYKMFVSLELQPVCTTSTLFTRGLWKLCILGHI